MSIKNVLLKEDHIYHVYQPIFNIKNDTVLGYEAFIRSEKFTNPEHLFSMAKQHEILFEVDILSIKKAIKSYCMVEEETLLFLNVYPSTIIREEFLLIVNDLLKKNKLLRGKVVFEINEDIDEINIWSKCEFLTVLNEIKKLGCQIAMDDVGKGAASLKNIIYAKPNFIKLDKFFSNQLTRSADKKRLISFFISFCKETRLIIEGIETKDDLNLIRELNATYAQGYLLGLPKQFQENVKSVFSI